jgi:hypothetical protein
MWTVMSTSVEPQRAPEGPEHQPLSKKEAKAQAAAAQAYSKSQRSWPVRHKFLTGLGGLGVVVVVIVATQSGGGSDTPTTASGGDKAAVADAPAAAKMAGLNAAVKDGKFEFTVKSMKCGVKSVGADVIAEKAQGQFCLVKMNVSNIGDEAQMLDGSSQYAFDAAGKKYSSSTAAAIVLTDAGTFLQEINPGNAVDGTVVFDVPKNVKIVKVELHDSPFSDGVAVKTG